MSDWSPQQQAALDAGRRWIDDPHDKQVFYLAGFAGTGKTTLARAFNEHVGGRAMSAAYTGKAASVMQRKGLAASTVHQLIYSYLGTDAEAVALYKELQQELTSLEGLEGDWTRPEELRASAVRRQLKQLSTSVNEPKFALKAESSLHGAPLLILDECSMIAEDMASDLLSFGVKTLVLGDPAQLPPVRGTGFFTDRKPDVMLTEVHRQAEGNPILRLATLAREGRSIPRGEWLSGMGCAWVTDKVAAADALAADMILCGTNRKRQAINRRHRELLSHCNPVPEKHERLCCLKNDHTLGLQNGTLWTVTQPDDQWTPGIETVYMRVQPEDGGVDMGVAAEACLFRDDSEKPPWSHYQFFTWGSCLTVHKAQGSEFGNVILFNDWPSNRSAREWLYTGITRAVDNLTIVL